MSNKELLEFLVQSIKKYPNDQELGKYLRRHIYRFIDELEEENREIERLTDEEIAVLSSLRNIR
tara:strand:- start:1136 stop:1327 length:192 start_codon:yes stop_codon:yes gene_type:complete